MVAGCWKHRGVRMMHLWELLGKNNKNFNNNNLFLFIFETSILINKFFILILYLQFIKYKRQDLPVYRYHRYIPSWRIPTVNIVFSPLSYKIPALHLIISGLPTTWKLYLLYKSTSNFLLKILVSKNRLIHPYIRYLSFTLSI